jgi:hypothetical protein
MCKYLTNRYFNASRQKGLKLTNLVYSGTYLQQENI